MQKQTFLLRNTQILKNLKAVLDNLPLNEEFPLEVKISESSRTLPQNDMFHALCGDVSKQMTLNNEPLKLWQWKNVFVSGHWMVT
ncbi:recombination protein NinB, partial [Proteus mirabilis]